MLLVAGGIVGLATVAALLFGPRGEAPPGPPPAVDVLAEDVAVAVLSVHVAHEEAVAVARAHADVLALPGPEAAARALEGAVAQLAEAVRTARETVVPPGSAALVYLHAPEHAARRDELLALAARARRIGRLAAVHDTVLAGAGVVDPAAAAATAQRELESGALTDEERVWALALLSVPGATAASGAEATAARTAALTAWRARVEALQPVRTDLLTAHLATVDAATLRALAGHPLAGPALRRLADGR